MLTAGTRLGPYEILAPLGAGGMGEVYRARDTKLDRDVAVKVLPAELADNPDALARFEREARAVAQLSHPGILAIHDFGRHGETAYAVMELLEGETLRARLDHGALPARKAVELAVQMAEGLAAAHEKGIVHRDLKPENVFVTGEGRAKLLDFGLAKKTGPVSGPLATTQNTGAGTVLGTVGYMSPEQVRGEAVDHRSDIFSFGAVLYEMLTGRRLFGRETAAESMAAILKEEPAEMASTAAGPSPALQRIVQHCLEKKPGERFQSARDVAFALHALSGSGSAASVATSTPAGAGQRALPAAVAGLLLGAGLMLLAVALAYLRHWPPFAPQPQPRFRRLTFLPGTIESAHFGPDGGTVYFSQRVAGGRPEIFVLHPGDSEPKSTGIQDALLLGVSATNELAFLRGPTYMKGTTYRGLLARAPGGGGALRELQEDVADAAWDGEGLATLRMNADYRFELEFPSGKRPLGGTLMTEVIRKLCLSRDGAHLALVRADLGGETTIIVYDREGRSRTLFAKEGDSSGESLTGMAWGPRGDLWVTELQGDQTSLWALSPGGGRRALWQGSGAHQLLDVSPDGRVLLAEQKFRGGVLAQKAGETRLRDLSILGTTQAQGLSVDGRSLLLQESPAPEGGTAQDVAYLRPMEGGPALRLGKGTPQTLSPDGRWVNLDTRPLEARDLDPAWVSAFQEAGLDSGQIGDPKARGRLLLFVPTGLGRPFALALPQGYENWGYAFLLADGQRVVVDAWLEGKDRWVLLDRRGGEPRILTREGFGGTWTGLVPLSPDETRLVVTGNRVDWFVQPLAGGEAQPIRGMVRGERVAGWSADGTAVFVRPELTVLPVTVTRLDLATGARTPVVSFTPPDLAGHLFTFGVFVTPDARSFAFTYLKKLSELYLVEGLR